MVCEDVGVTILSVIFEMKDLKSDVSQLLERLNTSEYIAQFPGERNPFEDAGSVQTFDTFD